MINSTKLFFICFFLIGISCNSYALKDSLVKTNRSYTHSPKKAAIFSAIFPGAGQIYNRKYWKTPIVWGLVGGSVYLTIYNHTNYKLYKNAYIKFRNEGVNDFPQYSGEDLNTLQNRFRTFRDFSKLLTGIMYGLNIIDATVDAHFFRFDVNNQLNMRIMPLPKNFTIGITYTLFK